MDQTRLHNSINRVFVTKNALSKRRTIILVFRWNQSCYNSSTASRHLPPSPFAVLPDGDAAEAPGIVETSRFRFY